MNDRDKRQFLLIAAVTAAVLGLYFWLVIMAEMRLLNQTRQQMAGMMKNAEESRALAAGWEHWRKLSSRASNQLHELEQELPGGDIYRWQLQRFLNPKAAGIQIVDVEPPKTAESLILGTNVPYATVSFGLNGRARYHDFGRFLAELENQYMHLRVNKLELQPTMPDVIQSEEARRLFFQIEFLSLSIAPSGLKRLNE